MIEEDQVGVRGGGDPRNLLNLARANQRGRIGARAPLHQFRRDFAAGAAHQFAKFSQRLVGIQPRRIYCGFRRIRRIRGHLVVGWTQSRPTRTVETSSTCTLSKR